MTSEMRDSTMATFEEEEEEGEEEEGYAPMAYDVSEEEVRTRFKLAFNARPLHNDLFQNLSLPSLHRMTSILTFLDTTTP